MNGNAQPEPTHLERVDLCLASRLVHAGDAAEPIATAQQVLDRVRRPGPSDAQFLAALLRLRGMVVTDDDAEAVLAGRAGRFSPIAQEHRMLRGLVECLQAIRSRAAAGMPPDGAFCVELFRTMTRELPRFRNNDLRRGPPWDAVLYVNYPKPEELRYLLDTFDAPHRYRDQPRIFDPLHPVRQGFRLLWRFARIAPFPDFNLVIAWLGMNAWLQTKGYPLLCADGADQPFVSRLLGGPPPTKIVQFEARLLTTVSAA
jgi:hypothetical protein